MSQGCGEACRQETAVIHQAFGQAWAPEPGRCARSICHQGSSEHGENDSRPLLPMPGLRRAGSALLQVPHTCRWQPE